MFADGGSNYVQAVGAFPLELKTTGAAPMVLHTNNTERMRIDSSGNVGIGTTTTTNGNLTVQKASATTDAPVFTLWNSNGSAGNTCGYLRFFSNATVRAELSSVIDAGSPFAGNFIFKTGEGTLTERMRIDSSGNVGIGTTSPATRLHVDGTIRYTNRPAAGTITAIGYDTNGDLKNSSSSLRYKYDIENYNKGLEEVMQLRPVSFKFNGEERQNIGYIAEEIDALGLTEVMLYNDENQPDGVLYANMVALLTKAIQEQQTIINDLTARIETLETK
jgi:hypothetical protein